MTAEDRRRRIIEFLESSSVPVTGAELSSLLQVSRQVIVQDVALLRAQGAKLVATPQGYIIPNNQSPTARTFVIACQHSLDETEEELNLLVDHGLKVIDVVVEHPVYGEMRGLIMVESRRDVKEFMSRVQQTGASLLSSLTKGVHLHTVECSRSCVLEEAKSALKDKGFLITE